MERITNITFKIAKTLCLVCCLYLCVWFFVSQFTLPSERNPLDYFVTTFNEGWHWVHDGEYTAMEVPGSCDVKDGESARFEKLLPTDIPAHMWLCLRTARQDMNVYIGDEFRMSYSTKDTRPFGVSNPSVDLFVPLDPADSGKTLALEVSSSSSIYAGVMRTVLYGDKMGIAFQIFEDNLLSFSLALFMLILGAASIIMGSILQHKMKSRIHLIYLGWCIFTAACWFLTQSELRQVFFYNFSAVSAASQFVLFLIPIPFVSYLDSVQRKRYRPFYLAFTVICLAVCAVSTTLIVRSAADLADLNVVLYILVALLVILVTGTLIRDVLKKHIREYKYVFYGIIGVVLASVVQAIMSTNRTDILLGRILSAGLFFLLIMAGVQTMADVLDSQRDKQHAELATEARTKFLASMSHEIRTPINAVLGLDEIILRETTQPRIREYAEDIQTAGRNLLSIVNDILDFSRIESGKMSIRPLEYDLSSVVNDSCSLVRFSAEKKGLLFHTVCDPALPSRFYGDEVRIRQILNNLLSNAVKYTSKGSITLEISGTPGEDGDFTLILSVKDTGIGIDKEYLPYIFDSFTRTGSSIVHKIEGAGLGLNIAQNLANMMGGSITVTSESGKGSVFTASIPQKVVSRAPIGNLSHSHSHHSSLQAQSAFIAPNAHILVIDDVPMNLKVFCGMLKDTLAHIDTAVSGFEGLQKLRENTYDIIFLDHMMPELNGLETLAQINAMDLPNRPPVIMLTANAILGAKEGYLQKGFHDYLSKPIQKDKLLDMLQRHLPKELVLATESETVSNQSVNLDRFLFLNTDLALSYYSGDRDFYLEIIRTFAEADHTSAIQEAFLNENWPHYQLLLHSLKSSSKSIGAETLSLQAQGLESAAKQGNERYIRTHHEETLLAYQELLARLNDLLVSNTEASADAAFDILVVDDDPINLKTARRILEKDFRVTCAESGAQALSAVRDNLPDLILLDIHMPDMNGFDVLRELKSNVLTAHVPVIFLSADTDADTELTGLKAGAMDFIHKPFIPNVMLERINRTIQQDHLQQHLQDEVVHKAHQMKELSLQAMMTLVQTIEAKDAYTRGHSTRVAAYCKELSAALGLSDKEQERAYYIGLLHDIGKIGIPDRILTKPRSLTNKEYSLIRKHPEIGYEILHNFDEFQDIEAGARWHHERYDGTGYPDGLAGEEIPFAVRILSVADAYDAIASQRSYQEGLSREYAISEFEKGKGTQFDPVVADTIIRLLGEQKL